MATRKGRKPLKPRLKLSKLLGIKLTPDEYRRLRKTAGDIPVNWPTEFKTPILGAIDLRFEQLDERRDLILMVLGGRPMVWTR